MYESARFVPTGYVEPGTHSVVLPGWEPGENWLSDGSLTYHGGASNEKKAIVFLGAMRPENTIVTPSGSTIVVKGVKAFFDMSQNSDAPPLTGTDVIVGWVAETGESSEMHIGRWRIIYDAIGYLVVQEELPPTEKSVSLIFSFPAPIDISDLYGHGLLIFLGDDLFAGVPYTTHPMAGDYVEVSLLYELLYLKSGEGEVVIGGSSTYGFDASRIGGGSVVLFGSSSYSHIKDKPDDDEEGDMEIDIPIHIRGAHTNFGERWYKCAASNLWYPESKTIEVDGKIYDYDMAPEPRDLT